MNQNDSDTSLSRSRLVGSTDHETLFREGIIPSVRINEPSFNPRLKNLKNLFSNNVFLDDEWHSEEYLHVGYEELRQADSSWRLREKMRTVGVALVVCLNIGIDPPDLFKPNPCAKKECWYDPSGQKQKGLEYIGNALQQQYEKWQSKAKYKLCLDPTSEDLRRVCMNLRKGSRTDRLLLHYNGHGVPKPTKNGEFWVFGKHYTHYTPVAICELKSWLGDPAIYVLDCSAAGLLIPHLVDNMNLKDSELNSSYDQSDHPIRENNSNFSFISQAASDSATLVLAACKGNEQLPFHPMYPVDIFTSCLTTPTTIAIRWFILQNPYSMHGVNPDIAETIPGKDNDRKTPRGELNWILTAITDTIAWNTLPANCFKKMFRKDLLVASLFRNFLLAKRIMKSFGCTPQSWPPMPDTTTHSLWQSWDMALESFLTHYVSSQRGSSMVDPRNNMPFAMPTNISFFNDQLSAFEMWLEFGTANSAPPPQLPVVLQVLLSQSHRIRALQLLKKFLALGPEAIKLSLILGIFPYILKLLQNPADDIKQTLISIWASVIGFDSSCRQELVREKSQLCFIQVLGSKNVSASQRCLAAFVLAEVCNGYKEGQQSCLQLGLHRTCTSILSQPEVMNSSSLKLWVCLCLFKLCEDFLYAKYLCITEAGHTALYPLLVDPDPTVRTAAVLALGELFGASALTSNSSNGLSTPGGVNTPGSRPLRKTLSSSSEENFGTSAVVEDRVLEESELQLALQILECCTDGSVMVRLEAVYALSKFFIQSAHIDCIKLVAKAIFIKNQEKVHPHAQVKPERRSTSPSLENNFGKMGLIYPWHLTPVESLEITTQVENFLKAQNPTDPNSNSPDMPPPIKLPPSSSSFGGGTPKARNPKGESLNNGMAQLTISVPSTVPPTTPQNSSAPHLQDLHSPTPDLPTLMASAYVRLWLALTEVQGRDPHSLVAQAAATIRFRVHALISIDERRQMETERTSSKSIAISDYDNIAGVALSYGNNESQNNSYTGGVSYSPSLNNNNNNTNANPGSSLNLMDKKLKKSATTESLTDNEIITAEDFDLSSSAPPLSPLGVVASNNNVYGSPRTAKARNVKFGSKVPRSSPFLTQSDTQLALSEGTGIAYRSGGKSSSQQNLSSSTSHHNLLSTSNSSHSSSHHHLNPSTPTQQHRDSQHHHISKYYFLEAFKDYSHLTEDDLLICFSSNHFEMVKKHYMETKSASYDPYQDPLSLESNDRSYRMSKLQEVINIEKVLSDVFKDVEDRPEMILERKNKLLASGRDHHHHHEDKNTPAITAGVPHNSVKFEQKSTLKMDSPMTTSLIMFHAFQDILVVASEASANIWSLTSHNRIVEVKNRHTLKYPNSNIMDLHGHTPSRNNRLPQVNTQPENSLFASMSAPRITSMVWINESYDPLLVLGSDDGVVKIWKDVASSDHPHTSGEGSTLHNNNNNNSPAIHSSSVEMATAFSALPDIAETSRGSGIVVSWQQTAGTLVVGGNSNTIRVWDLGREQNVRVFQTGVETCLTAMATNTVSSSAFNSGASASNLLDSNYSLQPNIDSTPVTWTFAGFADGSIAVYDERVHSNGGRVHVSHTHGTWVNYAHLRADVPEVVIGSVRGTVKFWDLRSMRTYKTLEVQKSPLTSLSVHNCAPILAAGSHAQFIKVLTLSGEQLGNVIKYYDGFLGQRIGPVSCLAFHPHRLLLGASSTDGIVSIYQASVDKHNL